MILQDEIPRLVESLRPKNRYSFNTTPFGEILRATMLDLATLMGCLLGIAVLVVGLAIAGVDPKLVLQPEAIVVVCGGTFTALLLQFSIPQLLQAVRAFRGAFRTDALTINDVADYLIDAAGFIRHNGILAMQPLLDEIEVPFLRQGFEMIIDNLPEEQIRTQLSARMELAYHEETEIARVFESAAGFTPTMGVLGAVIGLITALGSFDSASGLSTGIAGAFMSTLYGVGLANLFLIPIAGKLNQRAKRTWFIQSVMLVGLLSLSKNENPSQLRSKLEAFQSDYQSENSRVLESARGRELNLDGVIQPNSRDERYYQEVLNR